MKRLLSLFTALAGLAFCVPAQAKTIALLVGVAKYDEPKIPSLLGPRNDVTMIWRALKARGVDPADITVLTDGLPDNPDFPKAKDRATHDAILNGLDDLAAHATKGDTVLFYYSGHGDLQPADPKRNQDEPEADGMDQILLPADIGPYDPIDVTYKNAIVDNDLGDKIDAVRAKGAFVWAVIDACHSATATRGDAVVRAADLSVLGTPTIQPQPNPNAGNDRHGELRSKHIEGQGGLAGFFAVDTSDRAIEAPLTGYNLPMVGEGKTQRMGLFTYHLHRMLTANTASTFRDLAQEIVGDMALDRTGGKAPPPVFDGDLDQPLPGSDAAKIPHSVTATIEDGKLIIPVGVLQGFDVGARLALYAPGKPDQVIGHADVTAASAITATADSIDWAGGKAPDGLGTVAARVDSPAITFRFVVAPPPASDFAGDAEKQAADAAIATAFKDDAEQLGVSLGSADATQPDAMLRVKDHRLWIVRPDRAWITTAGAYDESPSLALDTPSDKLSDALRDAVWSLARAAKLIRVASAVQQGGDGGQADLVYTSKITKPAQQDAKTACKGDKPPPEAQASPLAPLMPTQAGNCTFIDIEVKNTSHDADYYVAGFYVDSLGGVSAIPAKSAHTGCVRTLPMGGDETLNFRFWIDTWDERAKRPSSTGPENFVILAVPKDDTSTPPKLCALTQPTLAALQQTRDVEGTRGGGNKLSKLIGGVAGGATRGVNESAATDNQPMSAQLFVFDVKP